VLDSIERQGGCCLVSIHVLVPHVEMSALHANPMSHTETDGHRLQRASNPTTQTSHMTRWRILSDSCANMCTQTPATDSLEDLRLLQYNTTSWQIITALRFGELVANSNEFKRFHWILQPVIGMFRGVVKSGP